MTFSLSSAILTEVAWRAFSIVRDCEIRFMPDGTIQSLGRAPYASWRLENGALDLFDADGTWSSHLYQPRDISGTYLIRGHHIVDERPGNTLCLERRYNTDTKFISNSTNLLLKDSIARYGWTIGNHTYGRPEILEPDCAGLTIGRFTSMPNTLTLCLGNHLTRAITTYPFASLRHYWDTAPVQADHTTHGNIAIGSDVWFGDGSMVMSGVTIGHGAVIAARCVVTRDVPPYAIVTGTPGQVNRYRFDVTVRERLLNIAWWDWPEDKLAEAIPLMMSEKIDDFLNRYDPAEASIPSL